MSKELATVRAMNAMYKAGRIAGSLDVNRPSFEAQRKVSRRYDSLAYRCCDQSKMSFEKLMRIRDYGREEKIKERNHDA